MFHFIEIIRAIATILIANSHFKGVYPTDVLSFGGGFGLALFYMISGFLLANIKPGTGLLSWYGKKVARLYIPLILLKAVEVLIGYLKIESVERFIREFIFPASWFGASMLILYLVYYWIVKMVYNKTGMGAVRIYNVICLVAFLWMFMTKCRIGMFSLETLRVADVFGIETPYLISLPVWMMAMLIGFELRKAFDSRSAAFTRGWEMWLYGAGILVFTAVFLAAKIWEKRDAGSALMILLPISYIGFACCVFCFFAGQETKIRLIADTLPKKILFLVSSCSLEIYYIQFPWIHLLKKYAFPVNWILIVIVTIFSGYILHCVSNIVYGVFMKKAGRKYE